MTIHVTPIPSTIEFAAPAFSLGVANAAGSSANAVASDSTLLVFDTSDPAAVSGSAGVGVATVSSRRDHAHAGIPAVSSTDEAITRYNGTAGLVQNYTSLAPTISDAGILSLTSGALKFPATAIASSDVNTLDDYEQGSWTPKIADNSLDGTGEGQGYSIQYGRYTKIGRVVFFNGRLKTTTLGTLTTTEMVRIVGLPFSNENDSTNVTSVVINNTSGLAMTAGESVVGNVGNNANYVSLKDWSTTTGVSNWLLSQWSSDGEMYFSGTIEAV